MELFKFTVSILTGQPLNMYYNSSIAFGFSLINDIDEEVLRLAMKPVESDNQFDSKTPNISHSSALWMIFNIGNCQPIDLLYSITTLKQALGKKYQKFFLIWSLGMLSLLLLIYHPRIIG